MTHRLVTTHFDHYAPCATRCARPWSPAQPYACGDHLLWLLQEGWTLAPRVEVEPRTFGPGRRSQLYHLDLRRPGQRMLIIALPGPFLRGLLEENATTLRLVPVRSALRRVTFTRSPSDSARQPLPEARR